MLARNLLEDDLEDDVGESFAGLSLGAELNGATAWFVADAADVEYCYFFDALNQQTQQGSGDTDGTFAQALSSSAADQSPAPGFATASTTQVIWQEATFDFSIFSGGASQPSGMSPPSVQSSTDSDALIFENPDGPISFDGDYTCGTDTLPDSAKSSEQDKSDQSDSDTRPDGDDHVAQTGGGAGSSSDTSSTLDLSVDVISTSSWMVVSSIQSGHQGVSSTSNHAAYDLFS